MKINYINVMELDNEHEDQLLVGYNNGLISSCTIYSRGYNALPTSINKNASVTDTVYDKVLLSNGFLIDIGYAVTTNSGVSVKGGYSYKIISKNVKQIHYFKNNYTHDYIELRYNGQLFINSTNKINIENVEKILNSTHIMLSDGTICKIDDTDNITTMKTKIKNLNKLIENPINNMMVGLLDNGDLISINNNDTFDIDKILIKDCKELISQSYSSYYFALLNNGDVYCCGDNHYNVLGMKSEKINELTKIPYISNCIKIITQKTAVCGAYATLIILENGDLLISGTFDYPSAVTSYNSKYESFTKIMNNIKDASFLGRVMGNRHDPFVILNKNDEVLLCNSSFYEMNIDSYVISKYISVASIDDINTNNISCNTQISKSHTIHLNDDGTIMTCGNNQFGQLGLGNNNDRNILTKVSNITDVKQVSVGDEHSMILYNDGTIATCGNNRFGQLGLGNNENKNTFNKVPGITNVEQISCGGNSSTIKLINGNIMTCGDNSRGQLCLGDNTNKNVFTKVNI